MKHIREMSDLELRVTKITCGPLQYEEIDREQSRRMVEQHVFFGWQPSNQAERNRLETAMMRAASAYVYGGN